MRKNIKKTIEQTIITACDVELINGKPVTTETRTFIRTGHLNEKMATSFLKMCTELKRPILLGVQYEDVTYQMSMEKFIENAEIVNEE